MFKPDESLDLSGVPCPQNTARALLTLEWMEPGEILEMIVDDGEPRDNVPPGLEAEGHTLLEARRYGGQWKLLVQRGDD